MTEPSSLERAIRDASDDRTEVGGALLGEDCEPTLLDGLRGADGKLPQNVFRLVRERAGEARRSSGRPKGSRNKQSDQLARLIVQKHGDPVDFMASLYSRPLDQMIELVLIADSTAEREERLLGLIDSAEEMVSSVLNMVKGGNSIVLLGEKGEKLLDQINTMLERVFDAAKALKMKPGDLAIKAINVQLAAARAVAEYTHSKRPTAVDVSVKADGILVMPGAAAPASFEQKDEQTRLAADLLAKALADGRIEAAELDGVRMRDGQLIHEAEWDEVDSEEGDEG